jgi:hypothetical protein
MTAAEKRMLTLLDRLDAAEAISALKARYFRLMDMKRWTEWRDLFAPDAVMDMKGEEQHLRALGFDIPDDARFVWRGPDEIMAAVSGALANIKTVHHGHMPELEILTPTEARGTWAMEDLLIHGPDSLLEEVRGFGHYIETYAKLDGRWLFQSLELTRLCLRPVWRSR